MILWLILLLIATFSLIYNQQLGLSSKNKVCNLLICKQLKKNLGLLQKKINKNYLFYKKILYLCGVKIVIFEILCCKCVLNN